MARSTGRPARRVYVVWHGRRTGVFGTWAECEAQVKGFAGARFKAFDSPAEAQAALTAGPDAPPAPPAPRPWPPPGLRLPSYSVDAACAGVPGPLEWRGLDNGNLKEVFRRGPYPRGTNNIGEFLAIVQALQMIVAAGHSAAVYSDSQVALGWVRAKTCRTNLPPTPRSAALFTEIRAAEQWLAAQRALPPVLKWETTRWGENPADFGRK